MENKSGICDQTDRTTTTATTATTTTTNNDDDEQQHLYLVNTTCDVILQHFARWKGGYGEPKMFFKGVVGKLQTFFWAVAP